MNVSAKVADTKLRGLLTAGDPQGEVRLGWHAKETLRGLYDIDCPRLAGTYLCELVDDLTDGDCPPELSRLGRTLRRWHHQIINWHHARVTNGCTEACMASTGYELETPAGIATVIAIMAESDTSDDYQKTRSFERDIRSADDDCNDDLDETISSLRDEFLDSSAQASIDILLADIANRKANE